ncbi:putative pumilio homolog 8, chloroplastic [Sesamum indicum]|uniref:Pumilio homolog 8, chloroplastic n=1 Tax=Sesamum indicum TaxID=4182 RepID=A0A8M8V083_SESIN|nr:putative pumilio homolog 8, chloroplastic [Sesamum indicum]
MERENLEKFRMNPTNFQDFSMPENHLHQPDAPLFPTGDHHRQQDTGIFTSGNHLQGVPESHHLPPEISSYHSTNLALMNSNLHVGPSNFSDTLYDLSLESEFNRLSLSAPPPPPTFLAPPPAYDSVVGAATSPAPGGSNIRNNLSIDHIPHGNGFSYPQFSNGDIQRMRVQSAARGQMQGLYIQPQNNHLSLADPDNFNAFYVNGNVNGLSDYDLGNVYNSRRSLNGIVAGYQPRPHRNGLPRPQELLGYGNHQLNLNRNNAHFQYRSAATNGIIESNDPASILMSDWRNGSIFGSRCHPNYSPTLEDLRGKMCLYAKDQHRCRYLQTVVEEGKPEEIHAIFSEVKDQICELMINQYGNYLIQKLLEVCNEGQMTELVVLVIDDDRTLKDICIDMYGTRAVQKLIEHVTTAKQRALVVSVLKRVTVALIKDTNGHHVIQHCLKFFSSEDNKHILNVVADNCLDIATDKSGCCVLQQCVAHAQGEPRDRLIAEITSNSLILSEHPYGNYVVQYILGLRIPHVTADIIAQLTGSYVSLSMNKYGSNVVEKCLREAEGDQVLHIINEITNSPNFLRVLQDPYGNYVAQSALNISKGTVRNNMNNLIYFHYAFLHSHPHGKRVLARTKGSKQRV